MTMTGKERDTGRVMEIPQALLSRLITLGIVLYVAT